MLVTGAERPSVGGPTDLEIAGGSLALERWLMGLWILKNCEYILNHEMQRNRQHNMTIYLGGWRLNRWSTEDLEIIGALLNLGRLHDATPMTTANW